ncbi:MAG: dicarboxylate/amino acid:cation symporter, partial [bacterium]
MKNRLSFLLSPWSVLTGMLAGIIIGLNFTGLVPYIEPVGEIYLSVLKMCVIPILASAVVTSIGKLVNSQHKSSYIRKLILVFVILLFSISTISVIIGVGSQIFYDIDIETQKTIGEIAIDSNKGAVEGTVVPGTVIREINSQIDQSNDSDQYRLIDFIINIVPENIFKALAEDENLQVIFFFLIFGMMMKFISSEATDTIMTFFDGVFMAFQSLIKIVMYLLPFGLAALVAGQFSQIGFPVLISLVQFILIIYFAA